MVVQCFSSMERCGWSEMNLDMEVDGDGEVNEHENDIIAYSSRLLLMAIWYPILLEGSTVKQ